MLTLQALMPTYQRLDARAANLLVDAFPTTTVELLPEWQLSLGLPDPCASATPTLADERAQVVARLTARGGQSAAYMIQYAATLGYTITITTFTFSRFGMLFGGTFGGADWANAWQINAPTFSARPFLFGSDNFGEPFQSWDATVLQCELQRVAPAHTTLFFVYH
jgi:uncharacterized protein YmfQ (DUF2313 family)